MHQLYIYPPFFRFPSHLGYHRALSKIPCDQQQVHCAVLSCSVMSDSLGPHGLQPARLLCPWLFSRQEHWSGLPCSPQGDLPNPQIEPRSPAVQADSLLSEPPGKPYFMHRGLLFSISKAFFIENSRASCPGLSPPLRGTAVQLPHQGHKLISD